MLAKSLHKNKYEQALYSFKCNLKELPVTRKSALSARVGSPSACTCPLVCDILNMIHAVECRIFFLLHCPCPEVSFSYSPLLLSLVFFLHRYTCNFQCDGCLFISFRVVAHDWVAPLCHTRGRYSI